MFHSFEDNRGSITSYKDIPFEVKEILDSRSYPNVLRGMHKSPYPKRIFVRKGKIYDFFYNAETGEKTEIVLSQGEYVDIPANFAHGFYTYEYSEILYLLGGKFDPTKDQNIYWKDPTFPLERNFPQVNLVISLKDSNANYYEKYDYYVLGAKGFLGSYTVKALRSLGYKVFESNERLQNLAQIREEITKSQAKHVICAAGISGKPTIDWCEDHEEETYKTNYVGVQELMGLTKHLGVHCVIYGSAQVFQGTKEVYTEQDPADLTRKVYAKWRTELEKILPFYENVLYLRILYPVSLDGHPKCFLQKMLGRAKSVHPVAVNLTILPSLIPRLAELCQKGTTGILNFVNPGQITLPRLLELWSEFREPLEVSVNREGEIRGNYRLSTERLESLLKEPLETAEDSIRRVLKS